MVPKCEIFMNCSKRFIGICKKKKQKKQKQIRLPNKKYIRDHRCQRTNIAYKCKIFEVVNLTFHGHYTYVCGV